MSSLEVSETHLDITRNALVKNARACVHASAKHTLLAAEGQMEKNEQGGPAGDFQRKDLSGKPGVYSNVLSSGREIKFLPLGQGRNFTSRQ